MQGSATQSSPQRFFHMPRFQTNFQKPVAYYNSHQYRQHSQQIQAIEFDGKRLRKAVARKTVDYNSAVVKYIEVRIFFINYFYINVIANVRSQRIVVTRMVPPLSMVDNPINAVTTKFVRTSTNKMRCPIFCVAWTPEGRRLVTGASSGEFTLWNGLTFNFETILQAHDSPVRCMVWSHSDVWMVTGDHSGYVKYWQSNMNNVKMFEAHKEPLRGISFCPTDTKFTTCSDDGTVRIWDFLRCYEEKILRGHGADVKCVDWHPQKSLIVSGSKDSQQPIKLWDPKSGHSLATIHAHKSTVMEVKWNQNGNWLLTASRDHLLKLFDIRNMSQEVQTFRGHKKEACSLGWHPVHESLFASGGSDGSIMFWVVGADKEVGGMEQAHDSCVWSLAWHPLGHILCSGSNDHTSKFWTRNRPGDKMRDKYNLNTLPKGQDETAEYDEPGGLPTIPGMGLEHGLVDSLSSLGLGWHPVHESLFASGGSDGSIMFWVVGADKEVGGMEQAHDSCVWSLAWHPLGHILCSGSNDHTSKFWTRNRPGDKMRDKYNLNTLPKGQDETAEYDEPGGLPTIPGMGLEHGLVDSLSSLEPEKDDAAIIPGLDFGNDEVLLPDRSQVQRKIPFAKPIPRQFQQQWMENKQPLLLAPPTEDSSKSESENAVMSQPTSMEMPPIGQPIQREQSIQDPYLQMNPQMRSPRFSGEHMMRPLQPGYYEGPHFPPKELPPPPVGQGPYLPPPGSMHEQDIRIRPVNPALQKSELGDLDDRQLSRSPIKAKPFDPKIGEWRSYREDPGNPDLHPRNDSETNNHHPQLWLKEHDNLPNESDYYKDYGDHQPGYPPHSSPRGSLRGRVRGRGLPMPRDSDLRYGGQLDSDMLIDHDDRLPLPSESVDLYGQAHKRQWNEGPGNSPQFPLDPDMPPMEPFPPVHGRGGPGFLQAFPRMRGQRGMMRVRPIFRGIAPRGGRGMRGGYIE
ncbi:pre-mRNA 3' end processing protein WDR33-like [Centruroides sculpturatus]|uniref:pre-mRNA 3' end processing protein WDR33-like n=1 Tax=Centruroides sculpturatus TaxID=218467 RepID=UPI000C6E0E27|nr:pre-mRNA 3' end processing protein WDR33-like [Centruroides sculpturatus]